MAGDQEERGLVGQGLLETSRFLHSKIHHRQLGLMLQQAEGRDWRGVSLRPKRKKSRLTKLCNV